ncbi:hypothetical protein GCM10022255_054500 [Dactylosporangium darangshiense]|uniref:Uncharacterized protein n=1 Tax=Dactylosporangium darangshiense TaxID=579108 RepID=A0ABP8DDM0_9ACTN
MARRAGPGTGIASGASGTSQPGTIDPPEYVAGAPPPKIMRGAGYLWGKLQAAIGAIVCA